VNSRIAREMAIRVALAQLYPLMPEAAKLSCAQRGRSRVDPDDPRSVYIAAAATARHLYTDYNARVPRDADEATKQAAREATRPLVRAKLREWGGPDRSPDPQ
jgi:hypothetical protein